MTEMPPIELGSRLECQQTKPRARLVKYKWMMMQPFERASATHCNLFDCVSSPTNHTQFEARYLARRHVPFVGKATHLFGGEMTRTIDLVLRSLAPRVCTLNALYASHFFFFLISFLLFPRGMLWIAPPRRTRWRNSKATWSAPS